MSGDEAMSGKFLEVAADALELPESAFERAQEDCGSPAFGRLARALAGQVLWESGEVQTDEILDQTEKSVTQFLEESPSPGGPFGLRLRAVAIAVRAWVAQKRCGVQGVSSAADQSLLAEVLGPLVDALEAGRAWRDRGLPGERTVLPEPPRLPAVWSSPLLTSSLLASSVREPVAAKWTAYLADLASELGPDKLVQGEASHLGIALDCLKEACELEHANSDLAQQLKTSVNALLAEPWAKSAQTEAGNAMAQDWKPQWDQIYESVTSIHYRDGSTIKIMKPDDPAAQALVKEIGLVPSRSVPLLDSTISSIVRDLVERQDRGETLFALFLRMSPGDPHGSSWEIYEEGPKPSGCAGCGCLGGSAATFAALGAGAVAFSLIGGWFG